MRTIRFFLIVIVVLFNGFSGEAQICSGNQLPLNLQNGLVAYYPFCGNANDGSGNGNNGIVNGAVPSTDRFGSLNSAYYFNGNGNRITVPNSNLLNPSSITINAWIRGEGTANYRYILQKQTTDNTPTQFSYSLLIRENEPGVNPLSFQSHFGIGDCNNVSGVAAAGNANKFITGIWQMVTSTIASDGTCTIYVDGKKDTVVKLTPYQPCNTPNSELRIGSAWDGVPAWFRGDMDDISIYSRVLSACEVNQLYHLPNTTATATGFDPLPDVQKVCADSIQLNAGPGFAAYRWNTGDTTPSITVSFGGRYKVSVLDTTGCTGYDSTLVHLQRVDILQSDTSICVGDSLVLSVGEGINDPVLFDFNSCIFADFINTGGGGAASATVNGNQSCGLNLEWPAVAESNRKNFSYGSYEIDMRASTNIANQYFTVLGVNIDSRPAGTDDVGYGIYVNGVPVKVSATHPAQYPNWYKLRVNITPDSLIVWIDNTQLYAGMHANFGPAPFSPISIGTYSSSFYDNVRYTPYGINQSIRWSTGDTTRSIVIRPVSTTVYTVSVSENGLTCMDSVRVTVKGRFGWNPLPDTIRSCTKSIILDAGTGFANYNWSNGQSTPQIVADSTGHYRVNVIDGNGCRYADTALVSLLNADILQRDTSICAGSTITLHIDSLFPAVLANRPPVIPPSLNDFLQAYYPFSGNTNDYSKNNYTGYGSNVALTTDRFGNPNSAYQFNGTDSRIYIPYVFFNNGWQDYTISLWFSPDSHTGTTGPGQTLIGTFPRYGFTAGYSYNGSRRVYHSKNSNTVNPGWDILNADPLNEGPMELGKWYHLIIVKRGLSYEYYLNGRLDKRVITTTVPAVEDCSLQLGAMMPDNSDVFNGKIDEVIVFRQALDSAQLQQLDVFTPRVKWSTGDTTKSITVAPDRSTTYYVSVENGVTSCIDSVNINVRSIQDYDAFPDTISVCGDSVLLNAGAGFPSYHWSTGDTVASVYVSQTGIFSAEITNIDGCKAADTVFISLLKANILNTDTSICKGDSVLLSIDSSSLGRQSKIRMDLPPALRNNLIAHFPFNGNANEILGNNGIPYNVLPAPDRNGLVDSAYSFNGINSSIVPSYTNTSMVNSFTYAFWANPQASINVPEQSQTGGAASNMFTNPCVLHPIHGVTFGGDQNQNAGSGIYLGVNGLYLEEHSDGWEAVPLSYASNLSGWHHYTIVYENKVPSLFIDGIFIKLGIPSTRNIYASLGKDNYPAYTRSGIGAGYSPPWNSTAQYYRGELDDLMYFNRSLTQAEINIFLKPTVIWSTGDTTPSIKVAPDTTTTYFVTVSNGITTCRDSVTVTVSAIKDFNPFPDTLCVCADSILLDAGPGFNSYDWSTGDTAQVITVRRKGWHKVIVTNESGCRAEDSVYIRRVFADILQNDTALKALTPFELSIDTSYWSENGYRVYWSTGDTTTSINIAPRQKTKYYVYVTDGFFICKDSITINVKCIGGYNPCKSKVAVCDRSVVLDAGAGYASYYWSTGDTTQQVTITSNGNYYVYVFDSTGAFGEDSAYVNLLAIAIQPRDTFICKGNAVQLVAGNLFNGNDLIQPTLAWSNGAQDTSITVTPLKTTKYYATLTNASNACSDSATIHVVEVDTSLIIIGDTSLCASAGDSIILQAGRGLAYQWLNNGIVINGANSREYATQQAGNYSVIITDTLGCLDTSRVQRVELNPLPTGTFLPPAKTTFCEGDSIFIAATGANGYQWYRNGILIPGATAAQYKVRQSGTYSVMYVSDKGCTAPGDTIQMQTSKKPDASFVFTTYCAGIASEFTSTSDTAGAGDVQYQWKFADGSTAGGPIVSHVFARSGNYPVQLILTSFDCANFSDTAAVVVRVQQPTPGIRYATINASVNVPVTLVARPLGSDFLWVPPDGLDNPRVRTPRLTPKDDVIYIITISNTAGCVTNDTLPVQVFDGRDIYVARGFTPNNDGKNDRLYPIVVGITTIRYFRIYNRWGNLVFASSSLLPQDGWDGTYNGKAQPSDTFTWMVEGVDIEGKVIRKSGSSVLIR